MIPAHEILEQLEAARRSTEYCSRAKVVEVAEGGHWFHRESPRRATELITGFVREISSPRGP